MKKIYPLLFILFACVSVEAQKYVPKVGIGTVLNYHIEATTSGQEIPLTLKVISLNDPMKFSWNLPGVGMGSFLIPVKALESGTKMRLEEPAPDVSTKFKEDETIMFISKSTFADMVKNQEFTLNKLKFKVKPTDVPYQINGKDADVLHAITANSSVEIWILNNPDFPVICKLTGNPGGIDFDLTTFKE